MIYELTMLAQVAQENAPSVMQTYGPVGALLLALGGWKGIARAIVYLQGGNGKSDAKYVPQSECTLRHEKSDQATEQLVRSIDKLEQAVSKLDTRLYDLIEGRQEGKAAP